MLLNNGRKIYKLNKNDQKHNPTKNVFSFYY